MEAFSDNREKIRGEIFKYAGFVFCSPACIMSLEYLLYENLFGGKYLITRITITAILFLIGLGLLVNSVDIMYNIDKREYYVRFYKQSS